MTEIVIVGARRTPQGRFLGALSKLSAVDLGIVAGRAALEPIGAAQVDLTIVGNVLSAGLGMNVARQIALGLEIPLSSPAYSINMMCASGMKAIMLGCDAIRTGQADVVLCGGTESMSNAPYVLPGVRSGLKLGDASLVDSLLSDGLIDAFDRRHVGLTVERLAADYSISRLRQDEFALRSHRNYAAAHKRQVFEHELATLEELTEDEHPRPESTLESLSELKPAFDSGGTVTAGNASGINDGAAMVVLCSHETARQSGWQPLAVVEAFAETGCEPARMGLGPVHAVRTLCAVTGSTIDQFDTIEMNEAFAAQTLACLLELRLAESRVNVDGGAIAMGHPIGASGARLVVHLAHRIARGESQRTLATLCVGGGMGTAMSLRTCDLDAFQR